MRFTHPRRAGEFFDEPAIVGDSRYWDGAVGGYNNPVLAGVCEALAGGVARQRIRALSIGTGRTLLPMQNDEGTIPEPLVQPRRRQPHWRSEGTGQQYYR